MSDVFDKATKAAKNVGGNVFNSAKDFGNSLYNSTKEQSELASLNVQKNAIEKKLNDSYAKIGCRYVEYMRKCEGDVAFDVDDILEGMKPSLEKLEEVKMQIQDKERQIKKSNEERALKKAQDEFETEKSKLDKALKLDVLTESEYQEKLTIAQKKLDNYEKLRKIEIQLDMGIISKAEYIEKIGNILN